MWINPDRVFSIVPSMGIPSGKGIPREENIFGTTLSGLNENSQGLTLNQTLTALYAAPSENGYRIWLRNSTKAGKRINQVYVVSSKYLKARSSFLVSLFCYRIHFLPNPHPLSTIQQISPLW